MTSIAMYAEMLKSPFWMFRGVSGFSLLDFLIFGRQDGSSQVLLRCFGNIYTCIFWAIFCWVWM